jgi:uncharacterized protein
MRIALTLALSCAALAACAAKAPAAGSADCSPVPPLTGRVVDNANLISPAAETALTEELAKLEAGTTDQMVVVTLPSLGGRTVEETGLALGRCWGIGQKRFNNGVVVLVAPAEKKLRIEVGRGLEGLLTDPRAKKIIDDDMVPRFKAAQYDAGIEAGIANIDRLLRSDTRRPQPLPPPSRS